MYTEVQDLTPTLCLERQRYVPILYEYYFSVYVQGLCSSKS